MLDSTTIAHDWPYYWAVFYAGILLMVSVGTFTPAAYDICESAGFSQPRNQPLNTYVYLFAGCQFMLGLSVAILELAGEWRAVSVIIACALPMGVVGLTQSAKEGFTSAFWQHAVMFAVGTSAGWRLMQENW